MIKYLTHNQIDKVKWDACIYNAYNGIVYAFSWYLDLVSPRWDALVTDDYSQVFPLTWRKKSGIFYLYQPPFTQQLGVFSANLMTKADTALFLKSIPEKFRFAEISLNVFNKTEESDLEFKQQLTHELDLIEPYEKICSSYTENLNRNIKKAQKSGLWIHGNIAPADIIDLFRKNKGKSINTLEDKDFIVLSYIMEYALKAQVGITLGVYGKHNELYAGAFFIATHSKVIFLFSGTADFAKNSGALHFLIDHFIKENSQRNLTLDFEGSNNKNLARFYKSFGASECIFQMLIKNDLPWILKKGVKIIKQLRTLKDS